MSAGRYITEFKSAASYGGLTLIRGRELANVSKTPIFWPFGELLRLTGGEIRPRLHPMRRPRRPPRQSAYPLLRNPVLTSPAAAKLGCD